MSEALLLDTHIALWLDSGSAELRLSTRDLIDGCWREGGTLFLSAVSTWEVALLLDSGRIRLDVDAAAWTRRFLARPGIEPAGLSHAQAARAYQLGPGLHRDPADRLLIATAIDLRCPMVTYDMRIAEFAEGNGARLGFAAWA